MAYNPEAHAFSRSERELPEAEEALYGVLVPENKKRAIQLKDFADLYGEDTIARDTAYVEDREGKFSSNETPEMDKKFGELFEAIINYQIGESDMMGPNAEVIVPARFDDIANGIDTIVQFNEDKGATSHLGLAIDVTGSEMQIDKKFANIKETIDRGNLSVAKYFKSENFRGELKPVARVVIGADHAVTSDISNLILRFERIKKARVEARKAGTTSTVSAEKLSSDFRLIREKLAEHPLHGIVLMEIQAQLEASMKYAQLKGKVLASEKCEQTLHIINDIIAGKGGFKKQIQDPDFIGNTDGVYRMIMDRAKQLGGAA